MQAKSPLPLVASHFRANAPRHSLPLLAFLRKHLAAAAVLGVAAACLGFRSTAGANEVVYTIVNYPTAEKDIFTSDQDSISGTIDASSSGSLFGTYTAGQLPANGVTMNFTITIHSAAGSGQPSVTYTDDTNLGAVLGSGTATFTASTITLNSGYISTSGDDVSENEGSLLWRSDTGLFQGLVDENVSGSYPGPETEFSDNNGLTDIGPSPWTIATVVPEPSSLALLGVSVVGLAGRRCRKPVR